MTKHLKSYTKCKKIAREKKITCVNEWRKFTKTKEFKKLKIPAAPEQYYKKQWKSWANFLGTKNVFGRNKKYATYEECKKFMRKHKIDSELKWTEYKKRNKIPFKIPLTPRVVYTRLGKWVHTADLYGTSNLPFAERRKQYLPFKEARKTVLKWKLNSIGEWNKKIKQDDFPKNIPKTPKNCYKNDGWVTLGHFIGLDRKLWEAPIMKYMEFNEARNYLHKLKLKNGTEYVKLWRKGKIKKGLPSDLLNHYKKDKKWKGLTDFLGSEAVRHGTEEYMSFEDAKKFVRKLGIIKHEDWVKYAKSGKKPKNIPYALHSVYKKDWKGFSDFCGTGKTPWNKLEYLSLNKMKKIVQPLKLKSRKEYEQWYRKNKPKNFTMKPQRIHKKEWKGWLDFLGDSYETLSTRKFMPFSKAKKIVRENKIKSQNEFYKFVKTTKLPNDFSRSPATAYKDKGWKGWPEFLGMQKERNIPENKLWTYERASNYLKRKKVKTAKQFKELVNQKKITYHIPKTPDYYYTKKQTWKGWGHFLGNNKIYKSKFFEWREFNEAKKFVHQLNIKSSNQWKKYSKSSEKPYDIPTTPEKTYKEKWTGWGDFLGRKPRKFLNFEEAKNIVQKLGLKNKEQYKKLGRSGKLPESLPLSPDVVYKK